VSLSNLFLLPLILTIAALLVIAGEGTIIDTINAVSLTGVIRALAIAALPGALVLRFLISISG